MPARVQRISRKRPSDRLPILLAAIGVGAILIASGVAAYSGQERDIQAAIAATRTASVPDTPTPTDTVTPTATNTPTVTLTPSHTPTGTLTPSSTPTATFTPTITNTPAPTPVPTREVSLNTGSYATPSTPPATEVLPPAPLIPVPEGVENILLLGSDKRPGDGGFRTDTIVVVSINKNEGTVNMLSLPRDMEVFVPGWTLTKINTVFSHGQASGWPGGGFGLLQETLLYNFGIQVGHYALVDLSGFQDIVDILGGVEVPVDCALQGYVLREPRQRREDFATYEEWVDYTANMANWMDYTLPVGVHRLDGYMALWYARFRYGTSDTDRAYRQQQVLRAIARQARDNGFLNIARVPELWREYKDLVETSMDIGNMLQFAPIAADLEGIEIASYVLSLDQLEGWPDPYLNQTGYLITDEAREFVTLAMQTQSQNYLINNTVRVEVRNGTSVDRLDEVAADRLTWNGIAATPTGFADPPSDGQTMIYDLTGRSKTSQLVAMQRFLRVRDDHVIVQPDPNRVFDYVVVLGSNYQSCTRAPQVAQPTLGPPPTATPEASATP